MSPICGSRRILSARITPMTLPRAVMGARIKALGWKSWMRVVPVYAAVRDIADDDGNAVDGYPGDDIIDFETGIL